MGLIRRNGRNCRRANQGEVPCHVIGRGVRTHPQGVAIDGALIGARL